MGGPDPQDPYWIGPCGPLDKQGQLNEGHDPRGEITRIDCLIMRLFMDLEKNMFGSKFRLYNNITQQ